MKEQNEKQAIAEMAKIIQNVAENHHRIWCEELAKVIYNAGYCKQSEGEWIDATIEQIIRKKVEVSKYWQDDVKQYRTTQGYSGVEHDVDNFLRGYGEAIEDIIAILDGMKGGE